MTVLGLMCGVAGTDVISATMRFSFGVTDLADGIELGALTMGLCAIADFLVVDMFANYCTGAKDAKTAIAETERQLKRIYR